MSLMGLVEAITAWILNALKNIGAIIFLLFLIGAILFVLLFFGLWIYGMML